MHMKLWLPLLLCLLMLATGCSIFKGKRTATNTAIPALEGSWVLDLLPSPQVSFDSLYPGRKPEISFDLHQQRFNGYTGCNRFNGPLASTGNTISFRGDIVMTYMACRGEGESTFLQNLKRVNRYDISSDGKTLTMIQGDIALMRFHRAAKTGKP